MPGSPPSNATPLNGATSQNPIELSITHVQSSNVSHIDLCQRLDLWGLDGGHSRARITDTYWSDHFFLEGVP